MTVCAIGVIVPVALAQKQPVPLQIEDLLATATFPFDSNITLSRDGQWVAYTIRVREPGDHTRSFFFTETGVPYRMSGCEVRVTDTKSGRSIKISNGAGSSWGPSWSPDGGRLAFYSDLNGRAQLWIWERATETARPVSDLIVRAYYGFERPQWVPDGKSIVAKLLPENVTLKEAAQLIERPPAPSETRTDNRATVTVYSSREIPQRGVELGGGRLQTNGVINSALADLALIGIDSGKATRLARGFNPRWFQVSPDGMNVAFTHVKGLENDNSSRILYDLMVVSLTDARLRVLAPKIQLEWTGSNVRFSPDGKLLSYVTSSGARESGRGGHCFIVPIDGGDPKKVTEPPGLDASRAPIWDPGGKHLFFIGADALWKANVIDGDIAELARVPGKRLVEMFMPASEAHPGLPDGGRSIYLRTSDDETQKAGFYKVNPSTGRYVRLIEEDRGFGSDYLACLKTDISPDGETLVYISQDAQHAEEIWVAGADLENPRQLTRINPQFDRYVMGASRMVSWMGTDGQKLKGALLLPAGYQEGRRYPLIVWVYGGAIGSSSLNLFGMSDDNSAVHNMQMFATRGYAVLYPDAPLKVGTPMQDLAKTVLPGVDRLIELGIADTDRLAVMGASYGGYATLALITQTTRFKAAICQSGIGNLLTAYGQMSRTGSAWATGWAEDSQGRMGGTPWQYRDRYIENSPFFYFDRVETPVMIVQGTLDTATPMHLSDEIFVALRRLGKEALYLKYEGEGHGIVDHNNQIDYSNRLFEWLDHHLQRRTEESSNIPGKSVSEKRGIDR